MWGNMNNEEVRDFYSKRISIHEDAISSNGEAVNIHPIFYEDNQQALLVHLEESLYNFRTKLTSIKR
jgi:hypothetical protein